MGSNIITGHGTPVASTDVPNKAYVDILVGSFFSTGDVKLTLKTVADTGWRLFDDGTIGSATSGASFQSTTAQALFTLLFTNVTDTSAPVYTSGGVLSSRAAQGSAAAAWAANCRMSLPKALGRALAVAGQGSGLALRLTGDIAGTESASLSTANLPPHTHSGRTGDDSPDHTHGYSSPASGVGTGTTPNYFNSSVTSATTGGASTRHQHNFTTDNGTGTSTPFNIMQPTVFLNCMVKL